MNIHTEDHFGTPLPEELQAVHEQNARAFIDLAGAQMHRNYPELSFNGYVDTQIDVHKGSQATAYLQEQTKQKTVHRIDPGLREEVDDLIKKGDTADNESPDRTRVYCHMTGDNQTELEEALKMVKLTAAEKSGFLDSSEVKRNILANLKQRDPTGGLDSLSKKFALMSHFIFR